MSPDPRTPDLAMDATALYREETFTDRRAGTIRVLTPVKTDGAFDATRQILYVGETQLLTAAGVLPLAFEIEATSLDQALDRFADAAQQALERTRREIEELRRQAASSIIVPDQMPGPLGGQGGLPPGGKIRLR